MNNKHIIFVPGKNPKPPAEQHRNQLWCTLVEGLRRAEPDVADDLGQCNSCFKLIAWNHLYYGKDKDISIDPPWIDVLLNKHGPTQQDIQEANTWKIKMDRFLYTLADMFPFLIPLFPEPLSRTVKETMRYFSNDDDIACQIRELLKKELRPLLVNNDKTLVIGHSLGSVIAYDTLWELSHEENLKGKIDFLTLGSPLGMNYVQHRMMGHGEEGMQHYPCNISRWVNISSVGDITALDQVFADDFSEMLKLEIIDSIEDHFEGVYNYFRDDKGLNVHRSYGYMVNSVVSDIIARWWRD